MIASFMSASPESQRLEMRRRESVLFLPLQTLEISEIVEHSNPGSPDGPVGAEARDPTPRAASASPFSEADYVYAAFFIGVLIGMAALR